jgi:hypothetical protein
MRNPLLVNGYFWKSIYLFRKEAAFFFLDLERSGQ